MATKSRDADAKEKAATPVLRGAAPADRGSATIGSSKRGFNRGAWTAVEDRKLAEAIEIYGPKRWKSIAVQAGLNRCGKSCRLRWLNYLRPNIKRGNISDQEEDLILRLHKLLGNRWALIAGRIPGRTDNEIKNYWNSHLSKKLKENQKQVRAPTRPRPHPPTNHHRRRNMSTGAKSENAATTTTTTRAAQGAVGMDEARCCYRGEVEGEDEAEEDDDDSNSNGTTSASGATTDHEDRHPSPKDAIFDVDDFFDFSNENPSSLEWVNNFIELDPSQFMPICINK